MPLKGDRKPWPFLRTAFDERWPRFSPDGHWVAYMSDESGQLEIYVRSFAVAESSGVAASTARVPLQVSTAGGMFPLWRADGQELYFLGPDGELMAAPITTRGAALEPGTPTVLFQTRIFGGGVENGQGRQFDVTSDGRFLINTVLDDASATPITLIQNWDPTRSK
jgi:Tol biopolymer transport system component